MCGSLLIGWGTAKSVQPEELFSIDGADLPQEASDGTIDSSTMEEMKILFVKDYAPGLDKFLEIDWYSSKGLTCLLGQPKICAMFSALVKQLRTVGSNDYAGIRCITGMEARLVWNLVTLPRLQQTSVPTATNGSVSTEKGDTQLEVLKKRISILEALLTNNVLDASQMPDPTPPATSAAQADGSSVVTSEPLPVAALFEVEFWRNLGLFTSMAEVVSAPSPIQSPSASSLLSSPSSSTETAKIKTIETALNSMRNVLAQLENRDVLYSIAIARYYGLRVVDFPAGLDQAYAASADDSDKHTKLFIAKHFIEQEANGKGTTQVIQRFCGMATKAWTAIRVAEDS